MSEQDLVMYQKGVAEGMRHQTPAPATMSLISDVKGEMDELRAEWSKLRGVALKSVIGGVIIVAGYGMWVGSIQSAITENYKLHQNGDDRIDGIDKRQQAADISSTEIKTKLIGIEASLIEIKQALKIQ
jgi:hypothetical protein